MISRRDSIGLALGAGAALSLSSRLLQTAQGQLIQRAIPSSGEKVPVIGLGSSASFREIAQSHDISALRDVLRVMVDNGARVFDTAPSYGASEEIAGRIAQELGIADRIFWATKVNAAPRGGGAANPAAARAQIEDSFRKLAVQRIDLMQVHNLGDLGTQLGLVKDLKKQGRVRYAGVTTTSPLQYAELEAVMRNETLDFIGIDYAIDNRDVEASILPLASERKIGVLAYVPFGRTSLFKRVGNQPVPDWCREFDARTWAQFFLKYVISHPAVTAATPATSRALHMVDNIAGGIGALPNEATRQRMVKLIDAMPTA